MAVYAAHLTRTLQGTPSVFQVTAQEALGSTVKPALRKLVEVRFPNCSKFQKYVIINIMAVCFKCKLKVYMIKLQYLAAVYPDKLSWSERWYDELYLVLDCIVQYHYLKHYGTVSLLITCTIPTCFQIYMFIFN